MDNYHYPGEELDLFESARSWKRYFAGKLRPYISGQVLEVGAGKGETTSYLLNAQVRGWTCLEPDAQLFRHLQQRIAEGKLPDICTAQPGFTDTLPAIAKYDTIIYIDVLEHIEDDRSEMERAKSLLKPGGRLIVLSPAYQFLYSPFDAAIGHYRRYNKKTLRAAAHVPGLREQKMFYLESSGVGLLLLNRFIFRKKYPAQKDIGIWQSLFIPISKLVDKALFYSLGKTIIGIWERE